jgi:N-acetylmuramoyl-L-alanine amidase
MKIALDAGHGGKDSGAVSKFKLKESDLALEVTLGVRDILEDYDVDIILTRDDDFFVPLRERSAIANEAGADIFVSIHFNSADNQSANGWEVFSHSSVGEGANLAKHICASHGSLFPKQTPRGHKWANLSVLRRTVMPACLWEGCFLSNPEEESMVTDPSNRRRMSRAIANGIIKHLSLEQDETFTVEDRLQRIESHLDL